MLDQSRYIFKLHLILFTFYFSYLQIINRHKISKIVGDLLLAKLNYDYYHHYFNKYSTEPNDEYVII